MNRLVIYALFAVLFLSLQYLQGQSGTRGTIFEKYEKLMTELQNKNAKLLSPENYQKAIKYYTEASEDFDRGKGDMESIRKKLSRAEAYATEALRNVETANSLLNNALEARRLALIAEAPDFAPELWKKAEEYFRDATEDIEDGDREDAVENGAKATQYYRDARVLALTNSILDEPRKLVQQARELDAPRYSFYTFQAAQNALKETEAMLERNPDDLESAQRKADEASYHARHAMFLTEQVKKMKEKEENMELLILKFEEFVQTVSEPFNYKPEFDRGFNESLQAILAYIANLKSERQRLEKENAELSEKLAALEEKQSQVSSILQRQQELEKKIEKVKGLFAPGEADVVVQNDNLLIRLRGLQFAPGKYTIQPEYFSLLTKLQRALNVFPDSYVVIEGHTDATGSAYKNKILSENRAKSVQEYLLANMQMDRSRLQAVGKGEQEPIASNKTREGRAQNRRIDVLISLPK